MVRSCGIRNFKIYLGGKSRATYDARAAWPPTADRLVDIARSDSYRSVFEMGFARVAIVCHAHWDYASLPDSRCAGWRSSEATTRRPSSSSRTGRATATSARRGSALSRRPSAGVAKAAMGNVRHGLELNQAATTADGRPCVANQVLPHVLVDYVSYSCYDARTEAEISACVGYIKSQMPRPTPLIFGEFGVPVRRRTDEQLASYVAGVLNVCAEHAIDLAFYWQLYDNEYDQALDGKRDYRGFGLVDMKRRVTSVYFLFRFGL